MRRLSICINDRLYEQRNFAGRSFDIKNHLNIIKVYYDFYVKLDQYFSVLSDLYFTGEARIKKFTNQGNFTNSVFLEFENGDLLPFTDIDQDTNYLYNLDVTRNFMTRHNNRILNMNTVDWSNNIIIKDTEEQRKLFKQEHQEEKQDDEKKLVEKLQGLSLKFKTKKKSLRKPKKSLRKPKKSTRKPKKSLRKPKKSTRKPKKSTRKPKKSLRKSKKSTRKPKKSTRKSKKSTRKPKKSTRKPTRKPTRKSKI